MGGGTITSTCGALSSTALVLLAVARSLGATGRTDAAAERVLVTEPRGAEEERMAAHLQISQVALGFFWACGKR